MTSSSSPLAYDAAKRLCCCRHHRQSTTSTTSVLLLALAVLLSIVTSSSSSDDVSTPPPFQQDAPGLLGGFNENDVTTPIRLHRNGLPIRHGRHFRSRREHNDDDETMSRRRRRRSARDRHGSREIPRDEASDFQLANYTLQAFGETFNLHLAPYESFISPGYVLEFAGEPDEQHPRPELKGSAKHCFYAGYVNGSPEETAIVSLCSGLFGAFRSNNSEYLIQPIVEDTSNQTGHETAAKRHRIYRRSTLLPPPGAASATAPPAPAENTDDSTAPDDAHTEPPPRRMCGTRPDFVDLSTVNVTMALDSTSETPPPMTTTADDDAASRTADSTGRRHRRHSDDTETPPRSRRRSKRYVVTEKTVEVMVTADYLMTRFHDDVEVYVLTLMAIVNDIFLHPSIQNLIKIVVVKLILVDNPAHGPELRQVGEEQLHTFARWQYDKNYLDDAHPEHFDVAIFLTRNDICSRVDSSVTCETLGIARIGSVCNYPHSCGVIEDGGLNSAFTIAHELGHTLGARHDEQSDFCPNETSHMVMSASLDSNAFPWHWSNCSARLITRFLNIARVGCLDDRATGRTYALPVEEPGLAYNLEAQCQMLYGTGSTSCSSEIQECGSLWCRDPRYPVASNCRTNHGKWAEGTVCNKRQPGWWWCQAGRCVEKRKHYPHPGSWGEWGRFGRCSLSCGGGVKSAERQCNRPAPVHGGDYCTGKRKKFRACNTQPCAAQPDLQLEQCTYYNNRSVHTKFTNRATDIEWVPEYPTDGSDKNLCKLNCRENTTDGQKLKIEPYQLLKDGTPCHRDSNGICVDGLCKRAGCDNVLGSSTKVDLCGICGGDNTSCELVNGHYDQRPVNPGYFAVTTFPAGATNIVIRQESSQNDESDKNYLVLQDWRRYYILNGNMNLNSPEPFHIVKRRSEYAYRGAVYDCDYSGSNSLTEIINCTKKIKEELHLKVLVSGKLAPPLINWYYYMPSNPRYQWSPSWRRCSQPCSGTQVYQPVCKTMSGKVVDNYYCSNLRRGSQRLRKCNTHCVYEWRGNEGKCSSRCGDGYKSIRYQCRMLQRVRGLTRYSPQPAPARFCTRPKPPSRARCSGTCLPVAWAYSDWSECSKTCGTGGRKTRTATCRDQTGLEWAKSDCRSEPILERSCALPTCYQWQAGDYTACMCSNTWITRRVYCTKDTVRTSPSYCDIRKKPTTRHNCHRTNSFCWQYSSWSQCSSACGKGYQMRKAVCIRLIERTPVPAGYCSQSQRPANEQKLCYASRNCASQENPVAKDPPGGPTVIERVTEGGWRTGEWTACSCSTGRRRRLVKCLHLDQNIDVSSEMCPSTKPHDSESCLPSNCDEDKYWDVGDWGRCSQSCGTGAQRLRTVRCIGNAIDQATGRIAPRTINNQDCENLYGLMPGTMEECTGLPVCPRVYTRRYEWEVSEWSQCSQSCGVGGQRRRTVRCVANTIDQSSGRLALRPAEMQDCANVYGQIPVDNEECSGLPLCPPRYTRRYEWKVTDWSQCSESCGNTGYQYRNSWCSGGGGAERCDNLRKPTILRECNRSPCPEWVIEPWGECDRKCGGGRKTRVIRCQDPVTARDVDERLCEILTRPRHHSRKCNRKPCKNGAVWRKEHWGECSTTCGRGVKTRRVTCAHVNGTSLDNEACAKSGGKRPRHVARCIEQRRCPKWKAGSWSQCPEACGEHYQLRRVTCRYRRKLIVDARCESSSRPQDLRMCTSAAEVCHKFEWDTSEWQGCSETCGNGWSQRTARCMQVATGKRVNDSQCPSPGPALNVPCSNGPCHAEWKIGPWAECSQTCGGGRQHRTIRCTYVNMTSYEEREVKSCRASTKPPVVRDCNRGECNRECTWTTGDWNECSATCGNGVARRLVVCMDRRTQKILPSTHCRQLYRSLRPDEHKPCYGPPCKPTSCREMKRLYNTNQDGEYNLLIGRQTAKIYCKGMDADTPFEYITLPRGENENFSEWFFYSNNNPNACPAGGARLTSCPSCQRSNEAGLTRFSKIRFLINHRRVQTDDFTFTNTEYGKQIAYGTAGDCFSSSRCPQGRFKINLTGTGFRVSNRTQWTKTGTSSTRKIERSNREQEVSGVCGGYCGLCSPEVTLGLILEHDPSYELS